jgi:tetratricopeptide (TPR) repeat protein
MSMIRRFAAGFPLVVGAVAAWQAVLPLAWADEPAVEAAAGATAEAGGQPPAEAKPAAGQELLDEAINAKFEIDDLDDFGRVIDLCKRAIDRGLDEGSRKFADDLYTGTLLDRSTMLAGAILETDDPDRNWRRIRSLALRDLQEVIARDPGIGLAHLLVARLESLPDGNQERAGESARRALEVLGDDPLPRAQATLVLASIETDPDRQGELLDAAVELAPRNTDVLKARGVHRLMHDDFPGARADLEQALEQDPDEPSILGTLGLACMMDGKPGEALEAFDRAIDLDPRAAGLLLQRARVHAVRGDRDKALADIGTVIELAPREAEARLLRARILQQADRTADAIADVEAVLEQNPELPAALELRGLIAAEQLDYPEAIRNFRKLVAKDPDDAVVLSQLGMLYLANKQPREAIRRFTKAIAIDAEEFSARRGRSDAAITIGDHAAALVDLEKALSLRPDDTGILNNLAWLLATSPDDGVRDADRAIELAEKACEKTEWKAAHIISTLAAGHAEKGDFEAARKFSQQAVAADAEAGSEVEEQLKAELASYEAGKPWRERQEMAEDGDAAPATDHGVKPADAGEKPETAARDRKPRRPFDD